MRKNEEQLKEIKLNDSGKYEYTGAYYRIDEELSGANARRNLILMHAALIALVIGSGLSESEAATKAFYVILPYVGEVTSFFILTWAVTSVIYKKDKIRVSAVEGGAGKIIGGATLLAMFAMIGCLMAMIHIIRSGDIGGIAGDIVYPAIKLCTAAVAMRFKKAYLNVHWKIAE